MSDVTQIEHDAAPLPRVYTPQERRLAKTNKPPNERDNNGKRKHIGKKLKVACQRIVWEGEDLDVAAKYAGLTTRTLRLALERQHVQQFIKREREVFRAHISAQNIHHARRLRDGTNAMASLGAMRFIEQLGDEQTAGGARVSAPGIVIVVGAGQPNSLHKGVLIDEKPSKSAETE